MADRVRAGAATPSTMVLASPDQVNQLACPVLWCRSIPADPADLQQAGKPSKQVEIPATSWPESTSTAGLPGHRNAAGRTAVTSL
jgi:hypothetical protein